MLGWPARKDTQMDNRRHFLSLGATAAAAPKLNTTATVHGLAKSYAGEPLDGATFQWTVRREARMPWWCGTFWRSSIPWGRAVEVASQDAPALSSSSAA